jgi:hypothetical protein
MANISLQEILPLIFIVALLYSSVGHGGASGYLAVMALVGIDAQLMKSSALVLNLFVAGIAFTQYYRAGYFRWNLFWPFAIASIPFAFIGATVHIDPVIYKRILGVCLVIASLRIFGVFNLHNGEQDRPLPLWAGLLIGAILGLLSGMIGIGGGILLSPVILLMGWGNVKETSAVSALFILVNSMSGLTAVWKHHAVFSPVMFAWIGVAIVGGTIGSYWGSRKANQPALRSALAVCLTLAAIKLIFV